MKSELYLTSFLGFFTVVSFDLVVLVVSPADL
jgi:hypothetical protein